MSEEELHRPSDQTDFKVEVNGQVQVQVLVHLHCSGLSKTALQSTWGEQTTGALRLWGKYLSMMKQPG